MILSDSIVDFLNEHGVEIYQAEEIDGASAELEWYSPAGEDCCFSIEHDGTDDGFIVALESYAAAFDPDEHAEMLIPSRGERGVPGSIRELIEDAEAIQAFLLRISDELKKISPSPAGRP